MSSADRRLVEQGVRAALALALVASAFPNVAWTADTADSGDTLEEVVVTALKRGNDAVQSVPVSIAVLDTARLERMGAAEFADFARSVSGLTFVDSGPANKRYVIRGINSAGEAQSALYYDNIPVTGLGGAATEFGGTQPDLALYDVQQIEVLRGPQGTLYGSNSQSGVIRIVTNKPKLNTLEGGVTTDLSDTSDGGFNYGIRGIINMPVADRFALRLVGYHDDADGFTDNPLRHLDNVNDVKNSGGRLSGLWQIADSTSLLGQFFYQKLETGGRPLSRPYDATITANTYPADGERKASLYAPEPHEDTSKVYALTLEHHFSAADFTLSATRFDRDVEDVQDYSVSFDFFRFLRSIGAPPFNTNFPIPAGGVYLAPQNSRLSTGEARIATKLQGPVNGVVGVYYADRDIHYLNDIVAADPVTGAPAPALGRVSSRKLDDQMKDLAVFGEVTFDVTDKLSLTGGARWFDTKRDLQAVTLFAFFSGAGPIVEAPQHGDSKDTIFKGVVSYKFTPQLMAYAQYAEGYRGGGTNASTVAFVPPQYDPDNTKNYEIGMKSSWLGQKLVLNLAAYRIDLQNLQVGMLFGPGGAFSGVGNIPGSVARSTGFELDLEARPISGLSLILSASRIDAKLVRDVPELGSAAVDGAPLLNVPDFTGSAAADYAFPIGAKYTANIGADVQYSGKVEHTRYDDDDFPTDAYTLVNLRTGVSWDNYDATLYVSNLFDEAAEVNAFKSVNDPIRILTNRPRTVGVRFAAKW
jgi:outer membrane receptor protein involved in Fe transport